MGKLYKKVLGSSRKRVGDVVFRNFRGEIVTSAYQPNVANPRTLAQQLNRIRFKNLSELSKGFSATLYSALGDLAKSEKMSPRNYFTKLNKDQVTVSGSVDNPSVTIAYDNLVCAKGGFGYVLDGSIDTDDPNTVAVTYRICVPQGVLGTDVKVHAVVLNKERTQVWTAVDDYDESGQFGSGSITVTTPRAWNGDHVHVYLYAEYVGENVVESGITKGMVSDSKYVGTGLLQ